MVYRFFENGLYQHKNLIKHCVPLRRACNDLIHKKEQEERPKCKVLDNKSSLVTLVTVFYLTLFNAQSQERRSLNSLNLLHTNSKLYTVFGI